MHRFSLRGCDFRLAITGAPPRRRGPDPGGHPGHGRPPAPASSAACPCSRYLFLLTFSPRTARRAGAPGLHLAAGRPPADGEGGRLLGPVHPHRPRVLPRVERQAPAGPGPGAVRLPAGEPHPAAVVPRRLHQLHAVHRRPAGRSGALGLGGQAPGRVLDRQHHPGRAPGAEPGGGQLRRLDPPLQAHRVLRQQHRQLLRQGRPGGLDDGRGTAPGVRRRAWAGPVLRPALAAVRGRPGERRRTCARPSGNWPARIPDPFWDRLHPGHGRTWTRGPSSGPTASASTPRRPGSSWPTARPEDPDALRRARVYAGLACAGRRAHRGQRDARIPRGPGRAWATAWRSWRWTAGAPPPPGTCSGAWATAAPGDRVEILAVERGRVRTSPSPWAERTPCAPPRSSPNRARTPAQREAFSAWTGQPFPVPRPQGGARP